MANIGTCNGTIVLEGSVNGTDVCGTNLVDQAGIARCHQKHDRFGKRLPKAYRQALSTVSVVETRPVPSTDEPCDVDGTLPMAESLQDSRLRQPSTRPVQLAAPAAMWASMVIGGRAMSS